MSRGGLAPKIEPTIATAPVSAEAVTEWNRTAVAGDVLVYFTGCGLIKSLPAVIAADRLHEKGEVSFFQQKRGPALFDYCMQKRARPQRVISRAEIEDNLSGDLKRLLGVLKRLARDNQPCPSNPRLAEQADLKDAESARYRMALLVVRGIIDIATTASGDRVITIIGTDLRTRRPER
jgi:hypothetical protein